MTTTPLTVADYQRQAAKMIDPQATREGRLREAWCGTLGELGETLDHCKKRDEHHRLLDPLLLLEELGDQTWYTGVDGFLYGIVLDELPPMETWTPQETLFDMLEDLAENVTRVAHYLRMFRREPPLATHDWMLRMFQKTLNAVMLDIAMIAHHHGFTMEQVFRFNLHKLHTRYPARSSA